MPEPEAIWRHDEISQGPFNIEGLACTYRLGLAAVDFDGFPAGLRVGRVALDLRPGPVETQRTEIQQRKPPPLVFDKRMESSVRVGVGRMLMLAEIETSVAADVALQMDDCHQECLESIGIIAAVLDERIAGEVLVEDLLLFGKGRAHMGTVDRVPFQRHYFPREVHDVDAENLKTVLSLNMGSASDAGLATAARYYLKGVAERPPDSIVHFWTALEALSDPGEKPVAAVERLLSEAGMPMPGATQVSVGRLYGLRGEIVHKARHQHPLLPDAHYMLEALLRGLIRHRLGIPLFRTSWPLQVNRPLLEASMTGIPGDWVAAQTVWHDMALPPARHDGDALPPC